jgi:hypothetical protein
MRSLFGGEPPWGIVSAGARADIPSLALAQQDFDALAELVSDAPLSATLRTDDQLLGTDSDGRVRLSASRPVQPGSSGSHWDASVRRAQRSSGDPLSLLMEPAAAGTLRNEVSDLTVQLLQDIGWDDEVCGNGIVEGDEECDAGIENSDALPGACRSSCRQAFCGDGVVDPGEQCEPGGAIACSDSCRNEIAPEPLPEPGAAPPVEVDAGVVTPAPAPDSGDGMDSKSEQVDSGSDPRAALGRPVALPTEGCACQLRPERTTLGFGLGALALMALLALLVRGAQAPAGRSPSCRS